MHSALPRPRRQHYFVVSLPADEQHAVSRLYSGSGVDAKSDVKRVAIQIGRCISQLLLIQGSGPQKCERTDNGAPSCARIFVNSFSEDRRTRPDCRLTTSGRNGAPHRWADLQGPRIGVQGRRRAGGAAPCRGSPSCGAGAPGCVPITDGIPQSWVCVALAAVC